jgi:hypothetical protein
MTENGMLEEGYFDQTVYFDKSRSDPLITWATNIGTSERLFLNCQVNQ